MYTTMVPYIINNNVWQQWFNQGYDANGNITSKSESTGLFTTTYHYDALELELPRFC